MNDLSKAENAFRQLTAGVQDGRGRVELSLAYAKWAAGVRAQWEAEHPEWVQKVRRDRD